MHTYETKLSPSAAWIWTLAISAYIFGVIMEVAPAAIESKTAHGNLINTIHDESNLAGTGNGSLFKRFGDPLKSESSKT